MDSYVCLALPGIGGTFHSGPHGAGRGIAKGDAAGRVDAGGGEAGGRGMGGGPFRYHSDNIAGPGPRSF